MKKRCPRGTRKNRLGNCVPKDAIVDSFNACDDGREWYVDKCYKTCKTIQHRNPETRRCRKTCTENEIRNPKTKRCQKTKNNVTNRVIPPSKEIPQELPSVKEQKKEETKQELVLKRFVNKIKQDMKNNPNVPGTVRKHSKLEMMYLKSICGDVGICLSLNNKYDTIMNMFDGFSNFKYLISSPKEIGRGGNGFIRILKYTKEVDNISFNSYVTMKAPISKKSDNLIYEYLVGTLCLNHFCKNFPVFSQTYYMFLLGRQVKNLLLTMGSSFTNTNINVIMNGLVHVRYPQDIARICDNREKFCITSQFYNNFVTCRTYSANNTANHSDFPFILFQVYYTLFYIKSFFTHYDLHDDNVGLVSLPDGYYIDYEYETVLNNNPITIRFKSKYIVKIIDYGRAFFVSPTNPTITSESIINDNNLIPECENSFGSISTAYYINNKLKNESSDLRFIYMTKNAASFKNIYKKYKTLKKNLVNNLVYDKFYGTPEIAFKSQDKKMRNVTDVHYYLTHYLHNNLDNSNGLNDAQYVGLNSLGTLKVFNLVKPMEFTPSVRAKTKGDKSRFERPDIANENL